MDESTKYELNAFWYDTFYDFVKDMIEKRSFDYDLFIKCRHVNKKFFDLILPNVLTTSEYYVYAIKTARGDKEIENEITSLFKKENILYVYGNMSRSELPLINVQKSREEYMLPVLTYKSHLEGTLHPLEKSKKLKNTFQFDICLSFYQHVMFKEKPTFVEVWCETHISFVEKENVLLGKTSCFEEIHFNNENDEKSDEVYYVLKLAYGAIPMHFISSSKIYFVTDAKEVFVPMFFSSLEVEHSLPRVIFIQLTNGRIVFVNKGALKLLKPEHLDNINNNKKISIEDMDASQKRELIESYIRSGELSKYISFAGYYSESEYRNEPFIFTFVNGKDVSQVGTDHLFRNNAYVANDPDVTYVEDIVWPICKHIYNENDKNVENVEWQ